MTIEPKYPLGAIWMPFVKARNGILFATLIAAITVAFGAETVSDGTYMVASAFCTAAGTWDEQTTEWPSCQDVYDCFSIRKLDDDEYAFSVQSTQTNGHQCNASGTARLDHGQFVFTGDGSLNDPDLTFRVVKGIMRFSGSDALCGARADWGSVAIPLSARTSAKPMDCGR